MVNPMQQYGRMPMPRTMPPRMPYPYGNGGYGYGGQNRNNMLKTMLFMQMMRNRNNAGDPSYASGHEEMEQQMPQQYASYGGGGHSHRSGGYRGGSRRYPSAKKRVPKKTAKKKDDDDNTEESTPVKFTGGYTGQMAANTGVIPSEGKILSDMNKISLNEQQFRNFIVENAIRVVKRYITEAYGDEDGNLLLDDDDDITNDDMVTPQDRKDVYTIDVFNVEADEGIDDMRYTTKTYESFDDAVEDARECARSYADCGEVVCVSVMGGEFETPSGDIFGDPEVIYTISNSDEETTMSAREEAGFATAEVDEYAE